MAAVPRAAVTSQKHLFTSAAQINETAERLVDAKAGGIWKEPNFDKGARQELVYFNRILTRLCANLRESTNHPLPTYTPISFYDGIKMLV